MRNGKQIIALTALVAALALGAALAQQPPRDEEALKAEFDKVRAPGMMNVPRVDGELLHDTIVQRGYKRALEIGTSNGYSGLWIALALRKTGGKLITLELDETRANLAAQNFKRLGFDDIIELRRGDALKILPTLEGPFDFVFIDAWKEDYPKYVEMVLPKVPSGGAILAHNVTSHRGDMEAFLKLVQNHPQLETTIDRRSSAGMSISFKK